MTTDEKRTGLGEFKVERVLLFILDGLGIGTMFDVPETRPADVGANTLTHIAESAGGLHLPVFERLGLGNIATARGIEPVQTPIAAHGRNNLAHFGADTYMGHQEMLGTKPFRPQAQFMSQMGPAVAASLADHGHRVEPLVPGGTALLVDGVAVVADNVEGEIGGNFNVTGSLDLSTFDHLVAIGQAVRKVVQVGRVIVCASNGWQIGDVRNHVVTTAAGQFGVDTPGLGVYNDTYQVRHIGLGVQKELQVTSRVAATGRPVTLIGKAADIVDCEGAAYLPAVETRLVIEHIENSWARQRDGLIVANVQETDLAGHEQNPRRWADLLRQADVWLADFLPRMGQGDAIFITGDHGNDPNIGHSRHTREMTPMLAYGPSIRPVHLEDRASLADMAATIAELLGTAPPQFGQSFATQIRRG